MNFGLGVSLGQVQDLKKFSTLAEKRYHKLEARLDVCLFVGYPKRTHGYLFYDPWEQRVIVKSNTHFLEEDY